MNNKSNFFMLRAIELSIKSVKNNGGPFGCVIVKDNKIIAEGFNEVTKTNDPTAHAEIVTIRKACKNTNSFNLSGTKIYELLSSGCPFNFNNFKNSKGAVTQTLLNHIDVIIHNKNINDLNLFVRRSFSAHLWSWLNDSARFV